MSVTFSEAKEKAKKLIPAVNRANDFGDAYAFYDKYANTSEGGGHSLVIMKDSGKTMSLSAYMTDGNVKPAPKRMPMGDTVKRPKK